MSAGRRAIRDSTLGHAVVAGAERADSETLAVGFEARWKRFHVFESGRFDGDLLRSHVPNLRLDGSEPVGTWSRTDDTSRFSFLIAVRYAFRKPPQ